MPIQKDGRTYYSQEEVDARIKASIRKNAREVAKDIITKNKREVEYV